MPARLTALVLLTLCSATSLADGSYAKLSQKYFHEDIRCPD